MKKIANVLLSAVLAVGTLLAAGCKDKACVHNVGTWEIVSASTCVSEGKKSGICGICLKTVEETIPVEPSAHSYGEWQISRPTESMEGSALKTCALDSSHTVNVVLPVLSEKNYDDEITTRPSVLSEGVRTYTFKEEPGIQFTETIPNTGVQTVRDAVDLGSDEGARIQIRKSEGSMGTQFFSPDPGPDLTHRHSYEYGYAEVEGERVHNYTYIENKTDNCDRWYYTDNAGTLYGLTNFGGKGIVDDLAVASGDKKYFIGSRFYLQYANALGYFFGTESLLDGLYRAARWSENGDFEEWTEESGGKTVYAFSFGHAEDSGSNSGYFSKVVVKFTLSSAYTIDWVMAQATTYVNNYNQVDDGGNALPDIITWKKDESTKYAYVLPGMENGVRYVSTIEMEQTMIAQDDVNPVNPHTNDKMYIRSFNLTYADNPVVTGQPVLFAAGTSTGYVFAITDVQPQSAVTQYKVDRFTICLRTANGDISLTETTKEMTLHLDENNKFALKAGVSGEYKVVVKTTTGLETEILCQISADPPNALYPVVYEYKDGGYDRKSPMTNETLRQTIYVNQPLSFTADVPFEQKYSASSAHTVKVASKVGVTETDLGDSVLSYEAKNGEPVTVFTPTKAGTYVLTLTSALASYRFCKIEVTVLDPPSFEELATKSYEGIATIEYANRQTVTLSFEDVATDGNWVSSLNESDEQEYVMVGGSQKALQKKLYTATATISASDGSQERLSCVYTVKAWQDGSEYRVVSHELSTAHLGDVSYGFRLGINEAYQFGLSRFLEYAQVFETVHLKEVQSAS